MNDALIKYAGSTEPSNLVLHVVLFRHQLSSLCSKYTIVQRRQRKVYARVCTAQVSWDDCSLFVSWRCRAKCSNKRWWFYQPTFWLTWWRWWFHALPWWWYVRKVKWKNIWSFFGDGRTVKFNIHTRNSVAQPLCCDLAYSTNSSVLYHRIKMWEIKNKCSPTYSYFLWLHSGPDAKNGARYQRELPWSMG